MSDPNPTMNRQHDSPDKSIRENSGPVATGGSAEVHDRTGLYIAILALLAAGMGLGFEIAQAMSRSDMRQIQDQAIDARIRAGAAQAEATAREARTTAKVTEDKLAELRDKLNAKGLNIPPLNGHD